MNRSRQRMSDRSHRLPEKGEMELTGEKRAGRRALRKRPPARPVVTAARSIKIATLNRSGLLGHGRKLVPESFAVQEKAGVLVSAGADLLSGEARAMELEGYSPLTKHGRESDLVKMRMGVIILSRVGLAREELKRKNKERERNPTRKRTKKKERKIK